MTCSVCGGLVDSHGRCWDYTCENARDNFSYSYATDQKPRKTPLAKKSRKQRRIERETKSIRELRVGEQCELCTAPASETHEIAAGSSRHKSMYDRRCQLRVCRTCHDNIQSLPYGVQLALLVDAKITGINAATGQNSVTYKSVCEALAIISQEDEA